MSKKTPEENIICRNRKASFHFHTLEIVECGIVLQGTEVKSLRSHAASLDESYARIDDNELWLIKAYIAPYRFGHERNHNPQRPRKLLVHAREVRRLRPKVEQRGLTLVPLRMYFSNRGLAKVTLALARGKPRRDKRQDLKARDHQREMDRALRRSRRVSR